MPERDPGTRAPTIILAGPRIPPVDGHAIVSEALIARFSATGATVVVTNTTVPEQRSLAYHLRRTGRHLRVIGQLAAHGRAYGRTLLLHINGDWGLVYSAAVAGVARLLGYRLFLYHHSSRYFLANSGLARALILVAGPEAVHIVATPGMGTALAARYRTARRVLVIDNSAYVIPADRATHADHGEIVLGLLSNLSRSKGLDLAIETLRQVRNDGVPCRLLLAGRAADAAAKATIEAAQREFGPVLEVLGPVWEASKQAFFDRIDVLLFPTLYRHETQSLVVPEAMANGVPVIAHDHGFVADLLGDGAGVALAPDGSFPQRAARQLAAWRADPAAYREMRHRAVRQVRGRHETAIGRLAVWAEGFADERRLAEILTIIDGL